MFYKASLASLVGLGFVLGVLFRPVPARSIGPAPEDDAVAYFVMTCDVQYAPSSVDCAPGQDLFSAGVNMTLNAVGIEGIGNPPSISGQTPNCIPTGTAPKSDFCMDQVLLEAKKNGCSVVPGGTSVQGGYDPGGYTEYLTAQFLCFGRPQILFAYTDAIRVVNQFAPMPPKKNQ